MIDPLRYRSVQDQVEYDQHDTPIQCWQCQREKVATPAYHLCHECGKAGSARPFCERCFFDYHATKKRGKGEHKPHLIVRGDPVIVQTLADGDRATFAKLHDWVTLDYTLTTDESDVVIEDTFLTKRPLTFQSGCSGPCVHLQLLGCTEIAAADILGSSDPYCAVYWKGELAGVTTTKHMTLNPSWANQTFVLPLAEEFMAVLGGDTSSTKSASALFNAGLLLPKLRIELYDWDRLSKNDFLGQVSISDTDILGILRQIRSGETDEDAVLSFNLMPKQSRGRLGIRAALRVGQLLVQVLRAENLPKADPVSLSDPYCEVYWNNRKVGTTTYIDDTLDPVWDLEIFSIKVDAEGTNSVELSTLRIECLDRDQFGSDDVLGQIELSGCQIKQLIGSGEQDGSMGTTEDDVVEEADMERVFEFIQTFQKHQKEEGILGKMIVGVPQGPSFTSTLNSGEGAAIAHDAAEITPVPPLKKKKSKRQNKQGDIAVETAGHSEGIEGKQGADRTRVEGSDPDRRDILGSGDNPGRLKKYRQQRRQGGASPDDRTSSGVEGDMEAGENQQGEERGQTAGRGRGCSGVVSAKGDIIPVDQELLGLVAIAEKVGDEKREVTTVSGDEHNSNPDGTKASHEVVYASMLIAEADNVVTAQASPSSCRESDHFPKPSPDDKVLLARIPAPEESAPAQVLRSDVEEGGGVVEQAPDEGATLVPRGGRGPKSVAGGRDPTATRYRDAIVQRFEEDRGVLVQYVDDNSAAWVITRFIPLLHIRDQVPAARSLLQRMWEQRLTLFHLHKRVLNVKRGLKSLLEMAMTGSQMQWYQLGLTDEQSGANFVRGRVNCRFLYHTRGSVIRGLDVAVSHMSLGERARVEVRSDYGFGEVYAASKIPPHATLVFVAQVAAIGSHSAKWVLLRRAVKDTVDDAIFRARVYVSRIRCLINASKRLVNLLGSLRKISAGTDQQDDKATGERGSIVGVEVPEGESIQADPASEAVAGSPDRAMVVKPRR